MLKKLVSLLFAMTLILSLVACGDTSKETGKTGGGSELSKEVEQVPEGGTIRILCGYGVGGTADAVARKYAEVAGELFSEYTFIVENMTGGDGFASIVNYTKEDLSTTDLLVYQYGVVFRHDLGKKYETEIIEFDREDVYPVASIDHRTWIVYSNPGITMEDIQAKAQADDLKMSGGNPLSDPHLALGSLLSLEGGSVQVIPYDGGAEQLKALSDGEVDVFVGSSQVGMDYVEAGLIEPVFAFSDESYEGFTGPDGPISVPAVAGDDKHPALSKDIDYSGSILPGGGYIATRTGASQGWIDKIVEISKAVWDDANFHEWIDSIGLNQFEIYDDEANDYVNEAAENAVKAFEALEGLN